MLEIELISILRIVFAGFCGCLVGLERKNRSKEAGIRTHCVVACGAAIIMIVSKYAFFDIGAIAEGVGFSGEIRLDPSRVASTIASGIGFLGAGMIFVHKNTISGLTTAAGIWATSGIGMAIGAGLYFVGIGATIAILVAQVLLHLDFHRSRNQKMKHLNIKNVTETDYQKKIMKYFDENNIRIHGVSVETVDNTRNYKFTIEIPGSVFEEDILSYIGYQCSIKPVA